MPDEMKHDETAAHDALDRERERSSQSSKQSDVREHHLDKTIEDSFPASDPPSTDPNPGGKE